MNEITGSRGSATSSGMSSFATGSTDHMPSGRSVSASSSPSSNADSGVAGAGLTRIGAPTAMAGATLWATRFSGKLNGAMPSTGPFGNRRIKRHPAGRRGLGVEALHVAVPSTRLFGGPPEDTGGAGGFGSAPT